MRCLQYLVVISLSVSPLWPQEPGGTKPITIGESFTFHSERQGEDRRLRLRLPADYAWSGVSYPVVYLLDAETNFHHTTGTLDTLSRLGHIPELIVVALENTDRTRDLTPPRKTARAEGEEDDFPGAGGADDFLDFLESELIPHVESSYRAAPHRVLIGHSFGGLFAVHALVARSDLFDGMIAISPSLWWDDGRLVDEASAFFEATPALPKRLFVSLAEEPVIMIDPYAAFVELLRYRAPKELEWEAVRMTGDDHGTTPIRSTYSGIRFMFPNWRPPSTARDAGLEGLERHFAGLSDAYGYSIGVPERLINSLGQQMLFEKKLPEARRIFEENVRRFPESANAYDSLGEALDASGETALAIENFERAVALASDIDHPSLGVYRRHLDDARAKN